MGNKYVKRQLILHDLGIDINPEIKRYYKIFERLIEGSNKSENTRYTTYNNNFVVDLLWLKSGVMLLEYDSYYAKMWIGKEIHNVYCGIYKFSHNNLSNILLPIMEYTLGIPINQINYRIE